MYEPFGLRNESIIIHSVDRMAGKVSLEFIISFHLKPPCCLTSNVDLSARTIRARCENWKTGLLKGDDRYYCWIQFESSLIDLVEVHIDSRSGFNVTSSRMEMNTRWVFDFGAILPLCWIFSPTFCLRTNRNVSLSASKSERKFTFSKSPSLLQSHSQPFSSFHSMQLQSFMSFPPFCTSRYE
jgi:hypothetical protein